MKAKPAGATADAEVACLGAALFCRAYGACLAGFAYGTLAAYVQLIDETVDELRRVGAARRRRA